MVMVEPEVSERTGRRHGERAVVGYLAFVSMLLAFGVDSALPAFDEIADEFGLGGEGLGVSLVGTSYFIGMAGGQLVWGPLSDRYGRAPVLRLGIVLYALGGLAAALAPSFGLLLLARLVWGLGASGPAVLRAAIARDLYEGDQMARVITLMMAVFLIGPILVPFAGTAILRFGSWRWIFVASGMLAAGAFALTSWFGETLAPEARRPLRFRPLVEAASTVVRHPVTMAYLGAQTLAQGAFLIYLGSSAPILDDIYGRGDQFAWWFGLSGVGMAITLLINNRLIGRFGAVTVLGRGAVLMVLCSALGLAATLAADGVPAFAVWFAWVCAVNALQTMVTPMANSLAMEPMGEIAGTASAIVGFATIAGGAVLAAIVDARIHLTVTPMVAANLGYGVAALALVIVARRQAVRLGLPSARPRRPAAP